jgi:hypothetical protein
VWYPARRDPGAHRVACHPSGDRSAMPAPDRAELFYNGHVDANRITPEAPKLRGARGDPKSMVADEEEVVRGRRQPPKIPNRNDVPSEKISKYLGREESRHIQQGVPSTFELDEDPFAFLGPLFQHSEGIEVDLPAHRCLKTHVRGWEMASRMRCRVREKAGG